MVTLGKQLSDTVPFMISTACETCFNILFQFLDFTHHLYQLTHSQTLLLSNKTPHIVLYNYM